MSMFLRPNKTKMWKKSSFVKAECVLKFRPKVQASFNLLFLFQLSVITQFIIWKLNRWTVSISRQDGSQDARGMFKTTAKSSDDSITPWWMAGERTTDLPLPPLRRTGRSSHDGPMQPNPCMKAIWGSSPLEQLDSRVDLWERSTSKAGAPRLQAEGVRERLRSFCLHWSSQTLTVKKREREMDSGKKMLSPDTEVWIPRNELSFFSVHLPGVMWHISRSPRCSLFLDLQKKKNGLTPCCPHFLVFTPCHRLVLPV